ncbi:MAG: CYTH domain-containing protein [Eubacteriales bacterium]|nr:CYTH domain-containing protein [Eubacteriales bacterium]
MEIERKFTVRSLPENLNAYACLIIEQAYLCVDPVIRIRRQDENYYLTYKGSGMLEREEYNLPLTAQAYRHLLPKADGNVIRKKRFRIPIEHPQFAAGYDPAADPASGGDKADLTIELDLFEAPFQNLVIAEVEFASREMAEAFVPPEWFLEDVTYDGRYHNSYLSRCRPQAL